MSTVNRLKHRKKVAEHVSPGSQQTHTPQNSMTSSLKSKPFNQVNQVKHTEEQQRQYEAYYEISKCNPNGISYTNSLFSHTAALQSNFCIPLGFVFSPVLTLDNESTELMQKSGDKIPRCSVCRAYMNCYNRFEKKKWICFLCNRENDLDPNYNPQQQLNLQLQSSLFQCLSPQNFYPKEPAQETYIFLIDINSDSASTRMLYYATAVMKEVLARTDLDEICIHFFTFDQLVQEYDFSGEDIKCVINDPSIQQNQCSIQASYLKDIREKLFQLLDSLEQISLNNTRKGSNFGKCFDYVFTSLYRTGGKFFILQSNEAIVGEPLFKEQIIKNPQNPNHIPQKKGPSMFETCNKSFMQKYAHKMLQSDSSISFFTFSRNYKNLKSIHDTLKLCNSQLKVYSKDNSSDLDKFYYEFSYLLGTTYFKNVRIQFLINSGWQYTAIYGNFYRTKQYISFQINNIQPSRKITAIVAPSNHNQFNQYIPPFCCIQTATNYQYKRQCYLCVATIVQPVTGYVQKLYSGIDSLTSIACLTKGFLSSLRMDDLNVSRKRITQVASQVYLSALKVHKKPENIPDSIMTIILSILGMLKSIHSQPDQINNTILMDKIISERNMVQFSGIQATYLFHPYLFNLSQLDAQMCNDQGDFVYPPTVEIKFSNVKQGMFLLDAGLALYLFMKQCDPTLSASIFGKPKISKNDELTQETLNSQTSQKARKVQNLIRYLRQQKSYGWVPLHIIRCGENSLNQRNFYLYFYGQKYEEFRLYRINLEQFTDIISKPNSY